MMTFSGIQFCRAKLLEILVFYICCTAFLAEAFHLLLRPKKKTVSQKNVQESQILGDSIETLTISIIIAVKNEASFIGKTLRNLEATTLDKSRCQVIFVDAGCTDNSIEVSRASSCCIPLIFVKNVSGIGRGACLNAGASRATGDILLFLRPDCLVPPGYDKVLRREFFRDQDALTAFSFGIDREKSKGYEVAGMWIWEQYINMRSRFCSLPAGFQGLAVAKKYFIDLQFPDTIVLEDLSYVMSFRREKASKIKVLEQKSLVSSVRYEILGLAQASFIDCWAQVLLTVFNLPVDDIYNICYVTIPSIFKWFRL